ncbi:MAG: hypothetical protein IJE07_10960 [Clostridia bacterium]|nr:hypothetical protein [Clostridia bacterium]
MMRIGRIGRGAIDGVAHALLLVGLSEVFSSPWGAAWLTEVGDVLLLLVPMLLGVLSAVVFGLCLSGEARIGRLCLWSVLFCLLTWGLALVNDIEWHVRLLPLREGSNGDGLMLVLMAGVYIVTALSLRGIVLIYALIWRWSEREEA